MARRTHDLKTWPAPFSAVWDEQKKHEVRKDDRGFAVGDLLVLREYDPRDGAYSNGRYTGRAILAFVTYVTAGGTWGLPEKTCVMSFERVSETVNYTIGCFDGAIHEFFLRPGKR